MEKKIINIDVNEFDKEGLYLVFPDSTRIILTREHIQRITKEYWANPKKIPSNVKAAIEFQRCPFCYLKGNNDFCDALRPILPLLDIIDKFVSFDEITAIYKRDESSLYYSAITTMQDALRFISIISLMQYCQIGKSYWKYYFGIIPLTGGHEMANRMYKNIYFLNKGDAEKVKKIIETFHEQLTIMSANQVKRLNLICKNDAFMNAFVNTQTISTFLSMDIENHLIQKFMEFEKKIP